MKSKNLWQSFGFAGQGLKETVVSQRNMQIHLVATVLVLLAGFYFQLNWLEWALVLFAIGLVVVAETFNTAIEAVVDLVSPDLHPIAGRAKNVAAGAVLLAVITAVIQGIIIFGRHLWR